MKENFIHVCFVIDESGSMSGSVKDVIGGFEKVLNEQKAVDSGTCSISLYKFADNVKELYKGEDVHKVQPLKAGSSTWLRTWSSVTSAISSTLTIDDVTSSIKEDNDSTTYSPGGCTAMYDGIGQAIDNIGEWLASMPEEERPEKNLIVIMTDGGENASHKYSGEKVKEMIKHQEEKYNWSFVYMGTDITTTAYADAIGIKNQSYATREDHLDNYAFVNTITSCYRNCVGDVSAKAACFDECLSTELTSANSKFMAKTGIDMNNNKGEN